MWKVNWWKPKNFSLLLLAALALSACKKEEPQDVDLGYDYFPNTVGTFIEYEVDSSYYESGVETNTQFYVREEFIETFIDGEGQLAMKIDRYTRPTLSDGWTLSAVYSQKRTSTTAERVEGNRRFIHMVFPINTERTWDGNAYNDLETWDYSYGTIGEPHVISLQLQFDDVVRVNQRSVFNIIDQEEAWAVFARDIGMIERRFKDLSYAFGDLMGVDVTYKLVGYGDL